MLFVPLLAAGVGFFVPVWPYGASFVVTFTAFLTVGGFKEGRGRWLANGRDLPPGSMIAAFAITAVSAFLLVTLGYLVGRGIGLLL